MAAASGVAAHLDGPAAPREELPPPPPPDMRQLMACAVEISDAMRYLHSRGMLHGVQLCDAPSVLNSRWLNDARLLWCKPSSHRQPAALASWANWQVPR